MVWDKIHRTKGLLYPIFNYIDSNSRILYDIFTLLAVMSARVIIHKPSNQETMLQAESDESSTKFQLRPPLCSRISRCDQFLVFNHDAKARPVPLSSNYCFKGILWFIRKKIISDTDFDWFTHGRFSDPYCKVLIFFHRGIRNKKVCKVKNFQVWVPQDNFE